jgi:Glycosyl hydrolases family 25
VTIGRIIDISSNQHPNGAPINWAQVAEAGVTTAIIKATQGTTYVNPFFRTDVRGAQAAGLDVLAYHFAEFTNAAAEAAFFLANAGEMAACGDFETSLNANWMLAFLQALGRPVNMCMGYGSASTFRLVYQRIPALPWVAAYGQNYPGWGVLWQFTSSAEIPGIVGNVDESSWHGSEIQYETLFSKTVPDPPVLPPVVYPGDNVQTDSITVKISNGEGWAASPVPVGKVVSVVPFDENPENVGRYDNIPLFRGVSSSPGVGSPNGVLVFSGFVDGTYGAEVWSVT